MFECRNPLQLDEDLRVTPETWRKYRNRVLIYASLGTIFNQDMRIYRAIIEAFVQYRSLEMDASCEKKICLLISSGSKSLSSIVGLLDSLQLDASTRHSILVLAQVPQVDVLKRAALFITHSGMNSTSESIHYGCPMLCVPITADQPLVAYRAADELGLGVRLDILSLDKKALLESMSRLLSDASYLERVVLFAKLSRKHNGSVESADLIIKYLQQQQKQQQRRVRVRP